MEASESLSCKNNNSSLFSALPESSNMYSNKDSNLISEVDAKAHCFMTVKEPKTTQACTIQEAKAACSMAIRNAETQRASQAELLQREHGKVMQDLETQAI